MTEEEYLAFERQSDFKHDYFEGLILDMSGVREAHSLLETELAFLFRTNAPKCRVYSSNLRVGVPGKAIYFYPDLSLTCAQPTFRDAEFDTLTNPIVIVEILSPPPKTTIAASSSNTIARSNPCAITSSCTPTACSSNSSPWGPMAAGASMNCAAAKLS